MIQKTVISIPKRAGLITCLFLWLIIRSVGQDQPTPAFEKAYDLMLGLELDKARTTLAKSDGEHEIYLSSLCNTLELFITEDEVKYEQYELVYEDRLDKLRKKKTPEALYAIAEIRLQWAFVYLKFGHEFDAAWNIRQAYVVVNDCRKQYPDFRPVRKTYALLQVMLGSVPDKFQWILSLLNMKGDIEEGLFWLRSLSKQDDYIAFESALCNTLLKSFVLQQTDSADVSMNQLVASHPDKKLLLFLAAEVAVKNSNSRRATELLDNLESLKSGLSFVYANYLKGEVNLHAGNYQQAIEEYVSFLENYKGLSYVKDAHYKIAVCYWLWGKTDDALKYVALARIKGTESTEADKYAARSLAEERIPNVKLSKLRYFTDGGYYDKAAAIAASVKESELADLKERVEFAYRKARLFHKSGDLEKCRALYEQTISLSEDEPWYFAPNSCLQLGYIFMSEKNYPASKSYFEKALTYKRHEYKNSIDSKAKSGLAQLQELSQSNSN